MAKIKEKAVKNIHKDCIHCVPFEGGFKNYKNEPIMGICNILPHKVLLNERTECKLWQRASK